MAKDVHVKQHTRTNRYGKRIEPKPSKNLQSAARSLRVPVGVEYAGYSYHGELTFDSSALDPFAFDLLSQVGEIVNPKPTPLEEMRRQIPLGAAVYDVPVSDREGVPLAIGKALFRAGQCLAVYVASSAVKAWIVGAAANAPLVLKILILAAAVV